ncbi:tetratricopeptide repeat protein [Kordia sp.]|uniref:tetratricopeptide repeat protein n=1 Tax=Kordia sp. TaxID=1965332 RepID=UPI003D28EFE9
MQHKKYTGGDELSAEELETMSETLIQAKFDRDKRNQWAQRLKDDYGVEKEDATNKRLFSFSKLAIAAAIVCIAGIVTYTIATFSTPSYDALVDKSIENLISFDNHAVITRGNNTVNVQVLEAITAYKNKEYDNSIARWEAIIATGKIQGFANYNIAMCYLKKTPIASQKAIPYLIEASKIKTVQEEANWALALVYLDVNQKEEAKNIFQKIVAKKAYKYKKAEIILKLLHEETEK